MRRSILYLLIIVVIIFSVMRIRGQQRKKKTEEIKPPSQVEVIFNKAMQIKDVAPIKAIERFEKVWVNFPQSDYAQKSLLEAALIYKKQGQMLKEKEALKQLVDDYPNTALAKKAQEKLGPVNINILFSPIETQDSFAYEVQPGDSLYKIAKNHNTTVELLKKGNDLSDSLIKPGMKLKVLKSVFKIEINKSTKELALKADNEIIKIYPVGIGADNSTPVGQFKIENRIIDPVWYKAGAIVAAGSPENILGSRWLGLSEPGYGIHGTIDLGPISNQFTQGCIRMRNEDVEELFVIVPVGTEVIITD